MLIKTTRGPRLRTMIDPPPVPKNPRRRKLRMEAIDRARADLETGNYASARRRVESYFDNCHYDPSLLGWFGDVARRMHDLHTAGRFLLLSDRDDPQIEECIRTYLSTVGDYPVFALVQTPRSARLESVDQYPEVVQARLRRLGLDESVPLAYRQSPPKPVKAEDSGGRWIILVVLLFLLLAIGSCTIGTITIIRWSFGDS